MKVIFLDIDGVLNSENYFVARHGLKGTPKEIKGDFNHRQIDPHAVGILNSLIEKTGAEIVLSSSWRYDIPKEDEKVNDVLTDMGLCKRFIGVTPRTNEGHRGKEIKMWLSKHDDVERYVIFDDDRDMLEEQEPFFVRTSEWNGLTSVDIWEAEKILMDKEKEEK